MLPCKVRTSPTLHEVGSKFVQSWAEVCTMSVRSWFEWSSPELTMKQPRTLYEVAPNFIRSSPELCMKFSSVVCVETETYFQHLPYLHYLYYNMNTQHLWKYNLSVLSRSAIRASLVLQKLSTHGMVHVTSNFTISADSPCGFSADHLRNCQGISAKLLQDFRGVVKGFLRKRQRVSAESSKSICGIVKGYMRICLRASAQSESSKASAESREWYPQNHCTVFLE